MSIDVLWDIDVLTVPLGLNFRQDVQGRVVMSRKLSDPGPFLTFRNFSTHLTD